MLQIKVTLLVLYVVLCFSYAYLLAWKNGSWQRGVYSLVVGLAFPGIGFLFLWFCDVMIEKGKKKDYAEFYIDQDYRKDELQYLQMPDMEQELNQVPMSEALVMNSYEYRRHMIMQILSEEDTLQYLNVLQDALENEDTETSHYASTVIMELQRKVQEELIEKEVLFEKNAGERSFACDWEGTLYKVLKSSLYDEQNKKRYYTKYGRVSDALLSEEQPEEIYFMHRIEILFDEKNYTKAQPFCQRYLMLYPKSEDAVLCQIQEYILTKDAKGMQDFMDSLSERPVVLTQKTLEYVRVFKRE